MSQNITKNVNNITKNVNKHYKKCNDDIKQESSKRVPCMICNKTFASQSSLSTHIKRCKDKNTTVISLEKEIDARNKREQELLDKIKCLEQQVIDVTTKIITTQKQPNNNPITTQQNSNVQQPIKRFICDYCNSDNFTYQQSLSRHMKSCRKKAELENKIDSLQRENNNLNKDKELFVDIVATNNSVMKNSMSAMSYFMNNFKNTPALKPIEDLSTMKIEHIDNDSFILQLLSMYRNGTLADYIGEYIVTIYKTKDSSKQTMWSSDVNRLTYLISEAVAKDKTIWVTDNKGIKVGERVIRPALNYIKPILQAYIKKCNKKIISGKIGEGKQMQLLEYQQLANHIIALIDNLALEKDIIKYIAPKIYWNKNSLLEADKTTKIKEIKHVKKNKSVKKNKQPKTSKPQKKIKIVNKPKTKKIKKKKSKIVVVETDSDEELIESDSYDSDDSDEEYV
jgi:hypothetical protein